MRRNDVIVRNNEECVGYDDEKAKLKGKMIPRKMMNLSKNSHG